MNGWKYVAGQGMLWRPDVETAMAEITGGLHGTEYDELKEQLDDLVAAVQREAAAKIRERYPCTNRSGNCWGSGCCEGTATTAADLIDPEVK